MFRFCHYFVILITKFSNYVKSVSYIYMLKNLFLVLVISFSVFSLSGCKEITDYINDFTAKDQPSPQEIFKQKLKDDLKACNNISRFGMDSFTELEITLRQAADKKQSTAIIRSDLLSFAEDLKVQNEKFKRYHFRTNEGAKLRNKLMQLNYATIQIIQVIDNPMTVQRRLATYLQKQRTLIQEYEQLKAEMQSKI